MNQLPCIKNKCLLYPACMSKLVICCNDLAIYHDYLIETHGYNFPECFKVIKSVLKEMDEYSTTHPLPKGWIDE